MQLRVIHLKRLERCWAFQEGGARIRYHRKKKRSADLVRKIFYRKLKNGGLVKKRAERLWVRTSKRKLGKNRFSSRTNDFKKVHHTTIRFNNVLCLCALACINIFPTTTLRPNSGVQKSGSKNPAIKQTPTSTNASHKVNELKKNIKTKLKIVRKKSQPKLLNKQGLVCSKRTNAIMNTTCLEKTMWAA